MYWYLQALKKYADFSGRARRKEYWIFFLANILISIVLSCLEFLIPAPDFQLAVSMLAFGYSLAVFLPVVALTIRRLHDTGRSGLWLLILLVPIFGGIAILVWLASDGDPERNQYGPDPKNAVESELTGESSEVLPAIRARAGWIPPLAVLTVIAIGVGGYLYTVNRGTAEARVLSACIGIPASPDEVASFEIASLGLHPAGKRDVRSIYGERFADGAVVEYSADGNPVALVAALRYLSPSEAAAAFAGFQDWAEGNCERSTWATFGARGVIHCDFSDSHDMLLLSDKWILDIETVELNGLPAADLADQIRDAAAAHWQGLNSGS